MANEFIIDSAKSGSSFSHYWELCVGSCHAVMGLRQDWRDQLSKAHRELGFRYVRFHGLLNDEMSVCVRNPDGSLRYCFFNIDAIFDFLLSIGMKPFIELGFMPEALASGETTCFHYKANVTPPADYTQWETLIRLLTRHLVDRYGLAEVQSWFFEVWNEPNLKFFWDGTQEEYFKLYETSVRAIKSVDASLKVGGPATSINAWIPEMRAFCSTNQVPLDFLSTHHYPTDDPLWKNSDLSMEEFFAKFADQFGSYERGILKKMTARARQEAGDLPLYYTEWNTSAVLPDTNHDEPYSAALVAKTIADNDGLVDGYSFWTFTDLFEEGGQYSSPFHGGFGLQTNHGIPKPTYRIFEFLHHLGQERLSVECADPSTVELLAVRGDNELRLLAYNHNIPDAEILTETVKIELKGLPMLKQCTIARVDSQHANPRQKWIEMGKPEYPTAAELRQIEQASLVEEENCPFENSNDGVTIYFQLLPHAVAQLVLQF